jgi:hypothetical protein
MLSNYVFLLKGNKPSVKSFSGHGVFAGRKIPKGAFIMEYRGELHVVSYTETEDDTGFRFFFWHQNKQCL